MNTEESSTTDEVLEEGRVTILEKQKEISVFEIIKEYTVLPESSVDITRAEINARKIKNFEQSFIKAEKVEQGLLELESSFRGYFQWIREKHRNIFWTMVLLLPNAFCMETGILLVCWNGLKQN